jgi:HK97 family phage prohead protease
VELIDRIRKRAIDHGAAVDADAQIVLKQVVLKESRVDVDQRLVRGIASTCAVDQEGEVLVPAGFDDSYFRQVKAVYWQHDYDKPVGVCRNYSVAKGVLSTTTYITRTAFGDDVLTMIEDGVVNGLSVGVIPTEYGPPSVEETKSFGDCRNVIRRALLLEYSITPMPCNQTALIEAVSKARIRRSSAVLMGLDDTPERKFIPVTDTPVRKKICIVVG